MNLWDVAHQRMNALTFLCLKVLQITLINGVRVTILRIRPRIIQSAETAAAQTLNQIIYGRNGTVSMKIMAIQLYDFLRISCHLL
jgi:hypothetical protein